MEVTAFGKYNDFLIVVDDYSGFTKSFPLINKSEAPKFYNSFCDHAWNLLNHKVTHLRCDNAKKFNEYLNDESTVSDEIPDDTP
jgi:hypothetical protein